MRSPSSGIDGVEGLLALFEALQNERNHRLKLVIVAAEKAADMRSVNNRWIREPERAPLLRSLAAKIDFVIERIHGDCSLLAGSDAFQTRLAIAPDRF
jgi:hypothetical protein